MYPFAVPDFSTFVMKTPSVGLLQRGLHNQRLQLNSNTRRHAASVAIESQPLAMACSLAGANAVADGWDSTF